MLKFTLLAAALLGLPCAATAQGDPSHISASPPPALIARGTPVRLMVLNEVSSAKAKPGDRFKLRVHEPVFLNGAAVIPVGTLAYGEVTTVRESGGVGKSGRLAAKLLFVDLGGRHIPIEGERSDKGNGKTGETLLAVVGLGLFGLFNQGHNAKMKAGELITAYVMDSIDLGTPVAPTPRIEGPDGFAPPSLAKP